MTKRQDFVVVIQALKKAVAFQDDLVKKLAGVALIERAIEKAKSLTGSNHKVYVLTAGAPPPSIIFKKNEKSRF